MKLHPTTPQDVSPEIQKFLDKTGLTGRPVYIKYFHISDTYRPNYCLSHCEAQSLEHGVEIVFGWIIWEDRSKSFIEAEFHSVIKENGELKDITPRYDGEEQILFVPDETRAAVRYDEQSWNSWSNFKSMNGHILQISRRILVRDRKSNKWV